MLSLETAKRLKEAGLKWEPKQGDFYWLVTPDESRIGFVQNNRGAEGFKAHVDRCRGIVCTYVFAPRLDQLLAEIEKRGYCWNQYKNPILFGTGYYDICLYHKDNAHFDSEEPDYHTPLAKDAPDEAAAEALLWILEKEVRA